VIRLVVATLLLAAIAVTVRLKSRGTAATRGITVSARTAVSRGAVVAIVEAEGRRLLIGAAANQVNVLADLGAAPARGRGADEAVAPAAPTGAGPGTSATPESATDDSLVHRLRRMTTRTADPALRPGLAVALRQETRRSR